MKLLFTPKIWIMVVLVLTICTELSLEDRSAPPKCKSGLRPYYRRVVFKDPFTRRLWIQNKLKQQCKSTGGIGSAAETPASGHGAAHRTPESGYARPKIPESGYALPKIPASGYATSLKPETTAYIVPPHVKIPGYGPPPIAISLSYDVHENAPSANHDTPPITPTQTYASPTHPSAPSQSYSTPSSAPSQNYPPLSNAPSPAASSDSYEAPQAEQFLYNAPPSNISPQSYDLPPSAPSQDYDSSPNPVMQSYDPPADALSQSYEMTTNSSFQVYTKPDTQSQNYDSPPAALILSYGSSPPLPIQPHSSQSAAYPSPMDIPNTVSYYHLFSFPEMSNYPAILTQVLPQQPHGIVNSFPVPSLGYQPPTIPPSNYGDQYSFLSNFKSFSPEISNTYQGPLANTYQVSGQDPLTVPHNTFQNPTPVMALSYELPGWYQSAAYKPSTSAPSINIYDVPNPSDEYIRASPVPSNFYGLQSALINYESVGKAPPATNKSHLSLTSHSYQASFQPLPSNYAPAFDYGAQETTNNHHSPSLDSTEIPSVYQPHQTISIYDDYPDSASNSSQFYHTPVPLPDGIPIISSSESDLDQEGNNSKTYQVSQTEISDNYERPVPASSHSFQNILPISHSHQNVGLTPTVDYQSPETSEDHQNSSPVSGSSEAQLSDSLDSNKDLSTAVPNSKEDQAVDRSDHITVISPDPVSQFRRRIYHFFDNFKALYPDHSDKNMSMSFSYSYRKGAPDYDITNIS